MAASNLTYPVICIWAQLVRIEDSYDALVTTTKAGVKNGMFRDLLIVDQHGLSVSVRNAERECSIGPFWGYNIFLNQRIRVKLTEVGDPVHISLDDVKKRIFRSFRLWHGWLGTETFGDLKRDVTNATTFGELIELLRE